MNPIAKEIASYLGSASMTDEEYLEHYGMPRRSGRYPWGSGEDPYQRTNDFLGRVEELKRNGWEETPENIKKEFGLTTTQYRMEKSISKDERRMLEVARAKSLKEDGLGASEIGRKMNLPESTVRSLLNQDSESRMLQSRKTADFLKEQIKEKGMIDVGSEVERDLPGDLRVSRQKLDTALYMLEREGYHVYKGRVPQPTNKNQMTTLKVLADKDVPYSAIYNYDQIQTINDYISRDGGDTYQKKFTYPASLDSKRLKVLLADDIGTDGRPSKEKDGIIELRRGVDDLSLGESRYSQVRILVDGTHYLKGVAVYSDNMPDGVDVIYNTSKTSHDKAMKPIKSDPDNPFGSAIKDADQGGQYYYTDKKTGQKKLGLINKTRDEGDWSEWADTLPSQFLAKQSKQMAKKQLDLAKANKADELNEIMQLQNPTIKKYYLDKFASECDSAAVSLKAAALPGQKYHVIVPVNTLKDNEVYAPQYKPGTKLALIRYPHGGTFEIPILTVTDKNDLAKKLIGPTSRDAVCINKTIADALSGADFDGDTVMCIPTHDRRGKVKIISTMDKVKDYDPITNTGLKGFDNKLEYGTVEKKEADGSIGYYRNGRKVRIMKNTNTQMGIISNLITDMTLAGASDEELAAAVRHSMVVIDAEKHKLDYKQSYIDNNIAKLQRDYQPKFDKNGNIYDGGGASTIISRAKGQKTVLKRRGEAKINTPGKSWYDPTRPEGALIYTPANDSDLYYAVGSYNKKTGLREYKTTDGKTISYNANNAKEREKYEPIMKKNSKTGEVYFTNKDGTIKYKTKARTIDSTRMAETDDAMTLVSSSKHPMEILYADYANSMKALANTARKEMLRTGNLESNPAAKKIYKNEVASLEVKLNDALKNTVRERTATRLASSEIKRKKEANPDMTPGDEKKLSQRSMSKYRAEVGSISRRERAIVITDKEWEAIQAGAISENKLKKILNNADADSLRQRAMPKPSNTLSTTQINRIKALSDSDFTLNQIAEKMNLSPTTVSKYLKGEK